MTMPYQLFTSEGGQSAGRRIWALSEYSISGSVGFGLFIPVVMGAFKKIVKLDFWILIITPVILATIIIGWPKGLASLHYAEAVVVLLSGLGVAYLLKLKQKSWVAVAYTINLIQFGFITLYSFDAFIKPWFTNIGDISRLCIMIFILIAVGILLREIVTSKKSKLSLFSGI